MNIVGMMSPPALKQTHARKLNHHDAKEAGDSDNNSSQRTSKPLPIHTTEGALMELLATEATQLLSRSSKGMQIELFGGLAEELKTPSRSSRGLLSSRLDAQLTASSTTVEQIPSQSNTQFFTSIHGKLLSPVDETTAKKMYSRQPVMQADTSLQTPRSRTKICKKPLDDLLKSPSIIIRQNSFMSDITMDPSLVKVAESKTRSRLTPVSSRSVSSKKTISSVASSHRSDPSTTSQECSTKSNKTPTVTKSKSKSKSSREHPKEENATKSKSVKQMERRDSVSSSSKKTVPNRGSRNIKPKEDEEISSQIRANDQGINTLDTLRAAFPTDLLRQRSVKSDIALYSSLDSGGPSRRRSRSSSSANLADTARQSPDLIDTRPISSSRRDLSSSSNRDGAKDQLCNVSTKSTCSQTNSRADSSSSTSQRQSYGGTSRSQRSLPQVPLTSPTPTFSDSLSSLQRAARTSSGTFLKSFLPENDSSRNTIATSNSVSSKNRSRGIEEEDLAVPPRPRGRMDGHEPQGTIEDDEDDDILSTAPLAHVKKKKGVKKKKEKKSKSSKSSRKAVELGQDTRGRNTDGIEEPTSTSAVKTDTVQDSNSRDRSRNRSPSSTKSLKAKARRATSLQRLGHVDKVSIPSDDEATRQLTVKVGKVHHSSERDVSKHRSPSTTKSTGSSLQRALHLRVLSLVEKAETTCDEEASHQPSVQSDTVNGHRERDLSRYQSPIRAESPRSSLQHALSRETIDLASRSPSTRSLPTTFGETSNHSERTSRSTSSLREPLYYKSPKDEKFKYMLAQLKQDRQRADAERNAVLAMKGILEKQGSYKDVQDYMKKYMEGSKSSSAAVSIFVSPNAVDLGEAYPLPWL